MDDFVMEDIMGCYGWWLLAEIHIPFYFLSQQLGSFLVLLHCVVALVNICERKRQKVLNTVLQTGQGLWTELLTLNISENTNTYKNNYNTNEIRVQMTYLHKKHQFNMWFFIP